MARYIFLSDQLPGRLVPDAPQGRVAWRLLAANNRGLGRSVQAYPTIGECVDAALRLHRRVVGDPITLGEFQLSSVNSSWHWVLRTGGQAGEVLAASVHRYQRRLECLRGARQFLAAAAAVLPVFDELRQIGPRPFGVYHQADPGAPAAEAVGS